MTQIEAGALLNLFGYLNEQNIIKIDGHAHSNSSITPLGFDDFHMKRENMFRNVSGDVVEVAKVHVKRGVIGGIFAEHNNHKEAVNNAYKIEKAKRDRNLPEDYLYIPGEEIETPMGHVIAIGHWSGFGPYCPGSPEDFGLENLIGLMRKVKSQGGVVGVVHPFSDAVNMHYKSRTLGISLEYLGQIKSEVDFVEMWNGLSYGLPCQVERLPPGIRSLARKLPLVPKKTLKELNKELEALSKFDVAFTAGSDNHDPKSAGSAWMYCETKDIISEIRNKRTYVNLEECRRNVPGITGYFPIFSDVAIEIIKKII
jgi:hypothetical protein